jgi:YegS/Rv2252/BmrU family lipid kinase
MSKTTVILNPIAGRGAGARLSPQIAEYLRAHGLDFSLTMTTAPGHATVLARDAAMVRGGLVVVAGGDGTANEALNGLMQAGCKPEATALAILPIGTGNDFAFGAGLPLNLREACQLVARRESRLIDVGWMHADDEGPRYFGNGAGMGFDAIANIESRKVKRLRGFPLYLVAVLRTLAFYYDAPQIKISIDGDVISQPSLMISIMNGHRVGGGFYVTPGARMDDGLLDLCIAGKVSRLRMVGFVPQFMRGSHTNDPNITMRQGREVTVVSELPWAAHVDGEIYGLGARRFELRLFPRRLRLVC